MTPRIACGDAMTNYLLDDDGNPVLCDDVIVWATWLKDNNDKRVLRVDFVGDVRVSTVFLGLDHNFGSGPPVLWETMIFGGPHSDYQERYTSREAAVVGHARALALAQSAVTEETR